LRLIKNSSGLVDGGTIPARAKSSIQHWPRRR
jgi:hypothetical protein